MRGRWNISRGNHGGGNYRGRIHDDWVHDGRIHDDCVHDGGSHDSWSRFSRLYFLDLRRDCFLRLPALARLASSFGDGRAEKRIACVAVRRKIQRHAVRAPTKVALARLALGHPTGRTLVLDRAHKHIAVRNKRHGLAIGRKRRLAHAATDLLGLLVEHPVISRGKRELLRLGALLGKIEPPKVAQHAEDRGLAVG